MALYLKYILGIGIRLRFFLLAAALVCLSFGSYGQEEIHPPEPTQDAPGDGNEPVPCGRRDGGEDPGYGGGGNGNIPPPVGLCLPINDYLLPLLLTGIVFGGYKIWVIEKKKEASGL